MFAKSGIPCMKYTGQKGGHVWDKKGLRVNAQKLIAKNIRLKKPPLEGLEQYRAFFDMEYTTDTDCIENFKEYEILYKHYPDAKFLLNIRNKFDWLRSRASHGNGSYLLRAAQRMERPGFEVLNIWMHEFDRHVEAAKAFFADKKDNFCVYDIDKDPVEKVMKFAERDVFRLQRRYYHTLNVSRPVTGKLNEALFNKMFEVPEPAKKKPVAKPKAEAKQGENLIELSTARAARN